MRIIVSFSAMALVLCSAIVLLCISFAPTKASALSVSVSAVSLPISSSRVVSYSCSRDDAQISFEVYDQEIATIENGIVYAHSVGSTSLRITATCGEDRAVATAKITVTENPSLPLVDLPSEITLYLIDKNVEEAKANGYNNEISFTSFGDYATTLSNKIVKISKDKIVATKEGEAVATFTSATTTNTYSVKIKVKNVPAKIEDLPESISLKPSQTASLIYNIQPSFYTGEAKVVFKDDKGILKIDGTNVTALSSGETWLDVVMNEEVVDKIYVKVEAVIKANLQAVSNCAIQDGAILLSQDQEACFTMSITTLQGEQINFSGIEIQTYGVSLRKELNYFHITSQTGGYIKIEVPDLASIIYIFVKVV